MEMGSLTHYGFIVPVSTLRAKFGQKYPEFINKLTLTHRGKVGPPMRMQLGKTMLVNGVPHWVLPRTYIQVFLKNNILDHVDNYLQPCIQADLELRLELYANQRVLVDWLVAQIFTQNRMQAGTATCLLNLRAGTGKTFVAAGIIAALQVPTLYVVPKRPLCIQAIKDLRLCFYDDVNVGKEHLVAQYNDRKCPNPLVTVCVINTALTIPIDVMRKWGLVILDEAPMYCTQGRKEIFKSTCAPYVLGMSATTEDRTDGFDRCAHVELAFDGVTRAEEVPGFAYEEDTAFDCQARIINYSGALEHTRHLTHESTGMLFTHYMHNQFIGDPIRLKVAVDELVRLYDWRNEDKIHCIYVFAEEVDILRICMQAFTDELIARRRDDIADDIDAPELDGDTGLFTGGLKDAEIAQMVTRRVLFTTYGYSGTGVSIVNMTAMMLLTPRRANMKQIFARILRRGSDISIPRVIVDIVDRRTSMRRQLGDRMLAYDHYGFKLEYIKAG